MANVDLQSIKKIRQSRKDAVFGYIRNDKTLKGIQIPKGIILICIVFLGNSTDEFDPKWKGKTMTLSNDNRRVEYEVGGQQNIYCKRVIESGYHRWRFKIVETSETSSHFIIGIWRCSEDKDPPLDNWFTQGKDQGYGYTIDGGKKTRTSDGCTSEYYGVRVKSGDIVEMIADFDELSLSYKVNDEPCGKSHDITQDKYRAAIFMSWKERIVEIVD